MAVRSHSLTSLNPLRAVWCLRRLQGLSTGFCLQLLEAPFSGSGHDASGPSGRSASMFLSAFLFFFCPVVSNVGQPSVSSRCSCAEHVKAIASVLSELFGLMVSFPFFYTCRSLFKIVFGQKIFRTLVLEDFKLLVNGCSGLPTL